MYLTSRQRILNVADVTNEVQELTCQNQRTHRWNQTLSCLTLKKKKNFLPPNETNIFLSVLRAYSNFTFRLKQKIKWNWRERKKQVCRIKRKVKTTGGEKENRRDLNFSEKEEESAKLLKMRGKDKKKGIADMVEFTGLRVTTEKSW